jgi:hypothetical protein
MSFGMVAPDDSAIRAELASAAGHYRGLLTRLAGKVELHVKAAHQLDAILRTLINEHQPLREYNEALRARGGGSYADKVRFGEQVASALEMRRAEDAEFILAKLQPHVWQTRLGAGANGFVNASFLVSAAARQPFQAAFVELRQDMSGIAVVRLFGPLPPYSFVTTPERSELGRWVS